MAPGRYQDVLVSGRSSVFPPDLQRALARLSRRIYVGRLRASDVSACLSYLSALPPKTVPLASRELPERISTYYYSQPDGPFSSQIARISRFRRAFEKTDFDLLKSVAGMAFLLIFHHNGYVREAALRKISGDVGSPFWFCAIGYQLNNWVPQVRKAASDCLLRVARATPADRLADCVVHLLTARRNWQRGRQEAVVVDQLMVRADVRRAITDRLMLSPDGAPRHVITAILANPAMDSEFVELCSARHPLIRAVAAEAIIRRRVKWAVGYERKWTDASYGQFRTVLKFAERELSAGDPKAALVSAAHDPSAQVRKIAMQALIDAPELWSARQALIQKLAKDKSASVRAGIDYILRHQNKERR